MTEQEFLAQYGTEQPSHEEDFLKKYGVSDSSSDGSIQALKDTGKNIAGGIDAVGDFLYGIPKLGAQGALAIVARGAGALTGNKATLNDTWKAAGDMIDEAAPGFGKLDNIEESKGYSYPMYPIQKFSQGVNYVGDKAEDITGSGDVGGAVKIGANFLPLHLAGKFGGKVLSKVGDTVKDVINGKTNVLPETPAIHTPAEQAFLAQHGQPEPLANQSDLPNGEGAFDNIRRQTAGTITTPQDITNTPMERVTDTLLNGKDNAATVGAENADQHSAVTNYWKDRADQQQQEAIAKAVTDREQQLAPDPLVQDPVHVNDLGNASDPRTMDALHRSTEGISYENVPPDGVIPRDSMRLPNGEPMLRVPRGNEWTTDENGIPVRQGLPESTVAPDYINKYMRQDEPARNDLGNAIQEANGPKLGPDEHFGSGQLDTPSPTFNNLINAGLGRNTPRSRQRGSLNPQVAHDIGRVVSATTDLVKKSTDAFLKQANRPLKALVGMLPEEHMSKVVKENMVYRPESGDKALPKALAQGKMDTSLWKYVQSGLALAAEKKGSVALKHIGSWLNWADKQTHFDNRHTVDPINGQIRKLDDSDFQSVHKLMIDEQEGRQRVSDDALNSKLSPKAVEAYKALRGALDKTWERSSSTRKALGLDTVTREQAYHASLHNGDFKQSFFDTKGKLVWHVASMDKLEQLRAEAWIKKDVKDIDWEKSKPYFGPDSTGVGVPKDIMDAYQKMMSFFDPHDPTTTLIGDAINKYNQERGLTSRGFDERFLSKSNIPGFEGNKPWLSDKENAKAFMNSQMKYLKDANHWNNLQEALSQMKPLLENPELIKNQPNIMEVAAAHVSRELGITGNVLAPLEKILAKATGYIPGVPKVGMIDGKPTVAYGVSRGSVYKGVADVKTGVYLTMLGANIPYMITTPLQAAMSVAQHRVLSSNGFTHNIVKTTLNSLRDISAGLAKHSVSSMTGKDVAMPMSDIGRRLLKYAEDNGILDKTIMDETGGTRPHAVADLAKKTIGATVTAPEKVARFSTFVALAHHLLDSGKLTETQALQMAEDSTNHALTSMRRADKPLVVDKFGTAGQLGYVFKSYLFNYYNQMSQMVNHGIRTKDYTPLAALIGATFVLGGALALPGVNEADGAYELWKSALSKGRPQNYDPVLPLGVKGTILKGLPTWASIGTASQVTGTNLGTRFNNQVVNVTDPLSDVAVPIQEGREILSFKDFALDPTTRNALQSLHANIGATGKGMMETKLDSYKNLNHDTADGRNPDNTMSYLRPNDINSTATDYKRTPSDECKRALGLYSEDEYKTKQLRYANNKEQERVLNAYNQMMKLALRAGQDGDIDRTKLFAQKAMKLIPDQSKFESTINNAVQARAMTPEELTKAKADNILNLQKLQRLGYGSK